MAVVLGFEPRQTESESAVLPLHNTTMKNILSIISEILATDTIITKKKFLSISFENFFKNGYGILSYRENFVKNSNTRGAV